MVKEVLTNPLALTILFAGIGAQVLKAIIFAIKYKTLRPLDFVATGGMPSSHSALMAGLTTSIYLTEQNVTTSFFLSLALTLIIIVDAMGVRRTAGEEGRLLHKLIKKTNLRLKEPHYALGHTPAQVIVGVILGIVVAIVVNLILY